MNTENFGTNNDNLPIQDIQAGWSEQDIEYSPESLMRDYAEVSVTLKICSEMLKWYRCREQLIAKLNHKECEKAKREMRRIERKYGIELAFPIDDYHRGVLTGQFQALSWMMGTEWEDMRF